MNKFKELNNLLNQDISNLNNEELSNMLDNKAIDDIIKILMPAGLLLALGVILIFGIVVYTFIKSLSLIMDYKLAIIVVGLVVGIPLYPITERVIKIIGLFIKLIFKNIA